MHAAISKAYRLNTRSRFTCYSECMTTWISVGMAVSIFFVPGMVVFVRPVVTLMIMIVGVRRGAMGMFMAVFVMVSV